MHQIGASFPDLAENFEDLNHIEFHDLEFDEMLDFYSQEQEKFC